MLVAGLHQLNQLSQLNLARPAVHRDVAVRANVHHSYDNLQISSLLRFGLPRISWRQRKGKTMSCRACDSSRIALVALRALASKLITRTDQFLCDMAVAQVRSFNRLKDPGSRS